MKSRRLALWRSPRLMSSEVSRALASSGMSREEAASKLGVSVSYLNRVAAGTKQPSEELERALVAAFGADPRAFARWEPAEVGSMVRVARAELGITAKYLSELTGVSRREICHIEKGRLTPTRASLSRLSSALVAIADEKGLVCESSRDLAAIEYANRIYGRQA